jgi:3-deoxy-D-manno-octulosonic-acid transferase
VPEGAARSYRAGTFSGLYRDAITAWYTPYEAFADALISAGARPDRVVVTGDMKFSNVLEASVAQPSSGLLRILDRYRQQQGPIIVGGSVNSVDETEAVVNGFSQVRQSHPDACLVLAPRHVHRPEMMKPVYEFLDASGYTVARRSQTPPEDLPVDILVIDVFGELMHFYELSTICYIGRNHGVLEPLRFDKPTVVATDEFWKTDYVTFPQYELMTRSGAILKADSPEKVGAIFLRLIDDRPFRDEVVACANRVCSQNLGAVDRVIAEISARDG